MKKGYRKLKVVYSQDKIEMFEFIKDKYCCNNKSYTIRVIDDTWRSTILWVKESKIMDVKLLCRNCGIKLKDEFDLM